MYQMVVVVDGVEARLTPTDGHLGQDLTSVISSIAFLVGDPIKTIGLPSNLASLSFWSPYSITRWGQNRANQVRLQITICGPTINSQKSMICHRVDSREESAVVTQIGDQAANCSAKPLTQVVSQSQDLVLAARHPAGSVSEGPVDLLQHAKFES